MTISQGVLKQKILQARRHSCHLTNSVKTHKAIKKDKKPRCCWDSQLYCIWRTVYSYRLQYRLCSQTGTCWAFIQQ